MLTADDGLGRELAELTDDCLTIGSQLADAASRLIDLQALPSTELIGRIEALRGDWDDLLSRVSAAAQSALLTPPNFPDPTVSLTQTIAIAEGTIAACRFEAERVDSRATVFQVLTKVQRLQSQDGSTVEGLAELCHQASVMAKRISESPDPSSLEDYALILEGTHRYCQLLSLIEDLEDRVDERDDLLIECTISLGRQIARAASRRQLCLASDDAIDPPSAPGSAVTDPPKSEKPTTEETPVDPEGGSQSGVSAPFISETTHDSPSGDIGHPDESIPPKPSRGRPELASRSRPVVLPSSYLSRPVRHPDPKISAIEDALSRPLSVATLQFTIVSPSKAEQPSHGPIEPGDELGTSFGGHLVADLDQREAAQPPNQPEVEPELSQSAIEASPSVAAGRLDLPTNRRDETLVVELSPQSWVSWPDPASGEAGSSEFDRAGEATSADELGLRFASAGEILESCVGGDYLKAALLAAGRAFAGLPEFDPHIDVLLVAHHVCNGSPMPPWPDWCYDQEASEVLSEIAPESARIIFLAALCQSSRAEAGGDPLSLPVRETLLAAFNELPEVRSYLSAVLEVVTVPGLWGQIHGPGTQSTIEEYFVRRRAFQERYETGLSHRNVNAAYIHRQDNYLSRLPAVKALHAQLKQDGPEEVSATTRRLIQGFLDKKPDTVTQDWVSSTDRVSGKVRLHGNQRVDLVSRAAEYLELANRAWRASEAFLQAPAQAGDVDRRREQFRSKLPTAMARSLGKPWSPLFARLTGGLIP
jgi:hypothetical protein